MKIAAQKGTGAPIQVLAAAAMLLLAGFLFGTACGDDDSASDPTAAWDVDQGTLQSLEHSISRIEDAFRSGDIENVINLTHPAARSELQPIFEAHQADLARVADLLATRQLIDVTYSMAEFEVTENGEVFYATFESWGEQWYLSSL